MGSLGLRIRQARESVHLSQRELADRVGVHPVTVSRWETAGDGLSVPPRRLHLVAEATDVAMDFLLNGTPVEGANQVPDATPVGAQDAPEGTPTVPLTQAMPLALGEVMLLKDVDVTREEFGLLCRLFSPTRGARAARYFALTPGGWFDILLWVRGRDTAHRQAAPEAEAAGRTTTATAPHLAWVEDDMDEVLAGA